MAPLSDKESPAWEKAGQSPMGGTVPVGTTRKCFHEPRRHTSKKMGSAGDLNGKPIERKRKPRQRVRRGSSQEGQMGVTFRSTS